MSDCHTVVSPMLPVLVRVLLVTVVLHCPFTRTRSTRAICTSSKVSPFGKSRSTLLQYSYEDMPACCTHIPRYGSAHGFPVVRVRVKVLVQQSSPHANAICSLHHAQSGEHNISPTPLSRPGWFKCHIQRLTLVNNRGHYSSIISHSTIEL